MEPLTRRSVLRLCASAAAAGLVDRRASGSDAAPASRPAPSPCAPGAWKKQGIVLEPTEPWEGTHIQNFTCPAEPLDDGRWRLWYSAAGGSRRGFVIGFAEGHVGEAFRKVPMRCAPGRAADEPLALGGLPEGWKPTQVVHLRLRDGRHRIYFWAHGPEILRYLAAESEDGRRYQVLDPLRPVLYHPNDRAAQGVATADGVTLVRKRASDRPADEPLAIPRLISNDATNISQLPDGTFEMYSVALTSVPKTDPAYVAADNAPGLLRVVDRYTSADGLAFETRRRVIERDAGDPVDQQFYYLASTLTPRGRVGMLGHYRVQAQTMDLEWCFSPDGTQWQRPQRTAWLPRGDKSQPDSYGIYGPHQLVERKGQWHLFYTAVNSAHNGKESHGPARGVIMLATTDSIWA